MKTRIHGAKRRSPRKQLVMTVLVVSPAVIRKEKRKKAAVETDRQLTRQPRPTPEVHMWNFDSDKAGEVPVDGRRSKAIGR